ncbi:MAG: FAD-dependent monooxygenase [Alphaproteobacteria bacterium]|nr:FAD-dependent monooxygenase [Alphaproteobacteria bacterium]
MERKILIVGAGIGGLTAALALQHFGFKVLIFEQAPELKEIGAGVVITPNAMHALNFLNVGKTISDSGSHPGTTYTRHYQTGDVIEERPSAALLRERFGADYFQVHRADLHDVLRDAVIANDPDCVKLAHTFVDGTQNDNSVTVNFKNGETYTGDALIGSDGSASAVRDQFFGHESVNYTGQVAFRALIPASDVNDILEGEDKRLYIGPGRMFLQYYVRRDQLLNVIGISKEPKWQEEGWRIPAKNSEFLKLYADFHPFVKAIINMIPEGQLFKWGLRDREPMREWVKGLVAMLGDAAHPMTPFLGQGACLAIEDGMVLGRCLNKYSDIPDALRHYEDVRIERGNGVQLASREQAKALQGEISEGKQFSPGRGPIARGLFDYNPVTVSI